MNINDNDDISNNYTKITDLDNFFNVYQDKNGDYFFNLNSTAYIDIPTESLSTLDLDYDCHWPLISYVIYGTPRLAWLLLKLNKIRTENIFEIKRAGDKILYLPKEQLLVILNAINSIEE